MCNDWRGLQVSYVFVQTSGCRYLYCVKKRTLVVPGKSMMLSQPNSPGGGMAVTHPASIKIAEKKEKTNKKIPGYSYQCAKKRAECHGEQ